MSKYPGVSPHISHDEFSCHHCKELPPDFFLFRQMYQELFDVFEHARLMMKKPLPVTSGYRCIAQNEKVKGAALSAHLFGMALDITMGTEEDAKKLYQIISKERSDVRMGLYKDNPRLVHVDVAYLITPRATKVWRRGTRWLI